MIGVIIPAYNCRRTLRRTLSSLGAQTDKNFKVYLIDDCSKEPLEDIVEEFKNIINIKHIRKEKNAGCGMARQTGIDACEEEYFTFLDSDDILMPYTISFFNSYISRNKKANLVHTHFLVETETNISVSEEGFCWCHGKLYKKEIFSEYNIKALPHFTCWCDDTYINTICFELEPVAILPLNTYIWCNNKSSITRSKDDKEVSKKQPVLECMFACYDLILKYKQSNRILTHSVNDYIKERERYTDLENEMLDDLIKLNDIISTTQDIEEEQKIIDKWRHLWEQS